MTARATHSLVVLAAVLVSGSCGDQGSTTQPMAAGAASVESRAPAAQPDGGERVVRILNRTVPLRSGVTTSAVIGPAGGRLAIPEAGLDIEFEPGAVSRPTRITVSAIAGSGVAYEFQPHGLKFSAPVHVTQSLKRTAAEHDPALTAILQGSYFDTDLKTAFVDTTDTFARVKERRPARFHSIRGMLEFTIEHFSGYLISTGFAGGTVDVRVD